MNRYQDSAAIVAKTFRDEADSLKARGTGSPDRFLHLGMSLGTALALVDALAFANSVDQAVEIVDEHEDQFKARQAGHEAEPCITSCIMVKGELGKL